MTSASLRVTATAAVSDVGRRRANNEDCVLRLDHVPLLAVADGMGGAEAGEVASATAIARLAGSSAEIADRVRAARDEAGLAELRACVERAFHDAHRDIIAVAEARGTPGMGTTLVVATILSDRAVVWHVGDSRAYVLRQGTLYPLTADHSVAMLRYRRGEISEEEVRTHPDQHRLYQAVGCGPSLDVDISEVELADGDVLLLCSDGLSGPLTDARIASVLKEHEDAGAAGRALVDAANAAGGPDNVSVVLATMAGERSSARVDARAGALRASVLMRGLSDADIAVVAPYLTDATVATGEVLVREGDPADPFYVVLEGRVRVTRGGVLLTDIAPGGHLGELGLATRSVRSATATALEPTHLAVLWRADFERLVLRRPAIASRLCLALLDTVGTRLRDVTARLDAVVRAATGTP